MTMFAKTAIALAVAGAMTASAATPTLARSGKYWGAAGAGFVAGAVVGSAIANSRGYGPGYGYAYSPGYAYGPAYDSYAYAGPTVSYETGPAYYAPRYRGEFGSYDSGYKSCATDGNYNRTDYGAC